MSDKLCLIPVCNPFHLVWPALQKIWKGKEEMSNVMCGQNLENRQGPQGVRRHLRHPVQRPTDTEERPVPPSSAIRQQDELPGPRREYLVRVQDGREGP